MFQKLFRSDENAVGRRMLLKLKDEVPDALERHCRDCGRKPIPGNASSDEILQLIDVLARQCTRQDVAGDAARMAEAPNFLLAKNCNTTISSGADEDDRTTIPACPELLDPEIDSTQRFLLIRRIEQDHG